ncbi:MAG: BON domain-containing protein [Arcobacteraceae bacterium]
MRKTVFLKAAIVASVLIVHSVPVFAAEVAKETITQPKPTVVEQIDDTFITSQVKMALLLHRSTSSFQTDITTTDGVVVIEGTVQKSAQRELITKIVEDVHGVKSIQNKMTIAKETPTIGEKIGDSALTGKVKMALVLHRSTGVLRTSVTTNDAVVTVSGIARNSAEKELVTKVVEDVDGVKSVVNTMTIE